MPLTLERGQPPPRPVIDGLDGTWQGAVTRNGVDLRLVLRVSTTTRGSMATFDSPDLGVTGMPVAGLARQAQAVELAIPASGARFKGTLSEDGARLGGTWTLPGQPDAQVVFTRTRAASVPEARTRPQTPKPPFPYRVEEVAFDNPAASGVTLAGTLDLVSSWITARFR